jgi:Leucine-rich repeat (LRR) protein
MQSLTWLDISSNHVLDISAVAHFSELRSLNASHNEIESLAPLSGVTITYYDFSYNHLRDLGAFTDVTYLGVFNPRGSAPPGIDLSHNQITDLTGLANSTGLVQAMTIDLRSNPISCAAQAENIAKLRQRVPSVSIDCPAN